MDAGTTVGLAVDSLLGDTSRTFFSGRILLAGVASSNACHSTEVLPRAESIMACATLNCRRTSACGMAGFSSSAVRMAKRVSIPSRVYGRGIVY